MRLVGSILFAAWVGLWLWSPKGEKARATTTVGGLAITGDDSEVAVAWLEVSHARPRSSETLHVATVGRDNRVVSRLHVDGRDDVAYRLADAGAGRYVLVSEHRNNEDRWFDVQRFGKGSGSRPADLRATFNTSTWEVAAAGDHLILVEEEQNSGQTAVHVLGNDDEWLPTQAAGRTLLGSRAGTLVRYEVGKGGDKVWVVPSSGAGFSMEVTRPHCIVPAGAAANPASQAPAAPAVAPLDLRDQREKVLSVVPLPGGYARLTRLGPWLCGDGTRDGQYVSIKPTPLGSVVDPRLVADAAGRLFLADGNEGKGALFLRRLEPDATAPEFAFADHPLSLSMGGLHRGYAIVSSTATGASALVTRVLAGETQVSLWRYPPGALRGGLAGSTLPPPRSEILLGPTPRYEGNWQNKVLLLAALPLSALLAALCGAMLLARRLRKVAPSAAGAPLPSGKVVVEAHLSRDADAPAGALRLRRGGAPMLLHIDGAEVLRASDVRSRREPRGDAVDVASGAPVVATGRLERGSLYRGEDTLHAGRGDLVLVGCTLAEARARVAARVGTSAAMLAAAIATIALLTR